MNFDSAQPIYKQIIDDYRKQLMRGELHYGDKIPSQREYAEKARVNPNTVQRAYREMEGMGMVETIRGQGTFIAASPAMLETIKNDMAAQVLTHFIKEMRSLGFQDHEFIELLSSQLANTKEADNHDSV